MTQVKKAIPQKTGVEGLIELMDILRSPGGCPWDSEQTHESLIEYLIEEAFEFAEAVETRDRIGLREELGDVLLQVVYHSRIAQEDKKDPFNIDDVANVIIAKLIKRHPHVFGDKVGASASEIEQNWEKIKKEEKNRTSVTDGVPIALPALMQADKLLTRVNSSEKKLNQPQKSAILAKIEGELNNEAEVGQFLLDFVATCKAKGIDSETALRKAIRNYREEIKTSELN